MNLPLVRKSSSIAVSALSRNKLQTALTIVGMTIGVATVLTMIALGGAAETSIKDQVRAAGMNVILVTSGNFRMKQQWTDEGGGEEPAAYVPSESRAHVQSLNFDPRMKPLLRRVQDPLRITRDPNDPTRALGNGGDNEAGKGSAQTLTLEDAAAVSKINGVQHVSPDIADTTNVRANGAHWVTRMHGAGPELADIRRAWVVRKGRFLSSSDISKHAEVAVVGSIVAQKLFGADDPIGQTLEVGNHNLTIVGVVTSNSWLVPAHESDDQFDAVYVPVSMGEAMLGHKYLDGLTVSTANTGDVTRVINAITSLLRQRHGIPASDASDFTVTTEGRKLIARGGMRTDVARAVVGNMGTLDKVTLDQLTKSLDRAGRTMTALLISIAAVSLIVGGIGIMNIMMLSVTQRTQEIGIRRAVGARSGDIMLQFLMEAIVLSVGGGALGIVVGLLTSFSITQLIRWSTEISPLAICISFGISALIGIGFGYYPARKASLVTPMTSLRYE